MISEIILKLLNLLNYSVCDRLTPIGTCTHIGAAGRHWTRRLPRHMKA